MLVTRTRNDPTAFIQESAACAGGNLRRRGHASTQFLYLGPQLETKHSISMERIDSKIDVVEITLTRLCPRQVRLSRRDRLAER